MSKAGGRLPVSIVTGFLGSGKTTLIGRVLHDPGFRGTAVIVNEFGEVALDHELIASSDESILTLSTGCLCCSVQTDLARTLLELLERREAGSAIFERVLIETSGLGDPAAMLKSMMADGYVSESYCIGGVVTLVDTVCGEANLEHYPEARHQVALADKVLISKTDIQPLGVGLTAELDKLNPAAPRMPVTAAASATLFEETSVETLSERLARLQVTNRHSGVEAGAVINGRPMPALALTMLLEALAEHCGRRLLRLKGLLAIEEVPGQPAVIHGVGHIMSPPEFLPRWPTSDASTRIVFITQGVPRYFVARLLDAIEAEVRQTTEASGSSLSG